MKVGAENRNKIIALVVLLLIAAFLLPRMFGGKSAPAAAAAQPARANSVRPAATRLRGRKLLPESKGVKVTSLDPTLRFDWLKSSEDQEDIAGKRNIFEARSEAPPPSDKGKTAAKGPPPPPPPPPGPPPIPLKFYGFATQQGSQKRIFLSTGDDVLIGKEGDIVNRRYKIVKINNESVEIEDVLNNNKQTIPLTQG